MVRCRVKEAVGTQHAFGPEINIALIHALKGPCYRVPRA
jgi:hypothetical protein